MVVGRYEFHRRAFAAFNQLAANEQAQVLEQLDSLLATAPLEWSAPRAKRLMGEEPLYLVQINESLRVLLRVANGQQIEVMDIVRHETLESFASMGSNAIS